MSKNDLSSLGLVALDAREAGRVNGGITITLPPLPLAALSRLVGAPPLQGYTLAQLALPPRPPTPPPLLGI
ncbi:MAG TPA: hypothetical protein VFF73_07475 [Planctomycetota bacterium]|nr:hypothetical protein [Planctomycetota bacterium]